MRPMIDAHLDLAWCALSFNRDLSLPVAAVRERERGMTDHKCRGNNTLTFPELKRCNIGVVVGTLLVRSGPDEPRRTGTLRSDLDYETQHIAYAHARGQLA
ncbi:MAG: peptidase, partial [Fimbriiglobus sp.]